MSDVVVWADLDANLCVVNIISVHPEGNTAKRVYCPALREDKRLNGKSCGFDKLYVHESGEGWHRTSSCLRTNGKVCIKLKGVERL
jgi:hypothetical protein